MARIPGARSSRVVHACTAGIPGHTDPTPDAITRGLGAAGSRASGNSAGYNTANADRPTGSHLHPDAGPNHSGARPFDTIGRRLQRPAS